MAITEEEIIDQSLDIVHTLDAARREQGVRVDDIPIVMGIDRGTWYAILKRGGVRLTTLIRAADGLGYSVRLVRNGDGQP